MTAKKSILITGATRGLGKHLATHFAQRGYRLALTGRKADDLSELQSALSEPGATVITETLDVTDYDAIKPVINRCAEQLGGIDIVIANAGVALTTPVGKGHFAEIRQTIDVNLTAAIATCEAAIELFRAQGRGQLVGVTSVAGVRGMPGSGIYSATKAAFGRYLQAVRIETRTERIVVTELAPGFIDTDINRDMPSRPFLVTVEKGTAAMADLIEREVEFRYVPPWPWSIIAPVIRLLPQRVMANMR
ncbi:MAG: SDR family NAD(P)-dependent oxidoreductase [Pseudomonadota bacterium]